jgi:hypothetical protein
MNLFAPFAIVCAVASASLAPSALGKAYFAPASVMIQKAEFIAIVDITSVEAVETKTEQFDFRERAQGKVVQMIKGQLPPSIVMHGNENFICAQVRYQPGRYLVFLERQAGLLTGCNWHLSVRPIKEDKVEWYAKAESLELSWQPLEGVIERIRKTPEAPKAK